MGFLNSRWVQSYLMQSHLGDRFVSVSPIAQFWKSFSLFAILFSSLASAAEVHLPQVKLELAGPMGQEALAETLKPENMIQMIEGYRPEIPGFDVQILSLDQHRDVTVFKALIQKNQDSEVETPEETESGGGLWDYWNQAKNYVSRTTLSWASGFINAELVGEISQRPFTCSDPFAPNGYEFTVDFSQSSYVISTQVNQVRYRVCYLQQRMDLGNEGLQVMIQSAFEPGSLMSTTVGNPEELLAKPENQSLIQSQISAWSQAFTETFYRHQAKLIQETGIMPAGRAE